MYIWGRHRGVEVKTLLRYLRQSHLDRKHTHTHTHQKGIKKKAKRQSRDMGHGNKRPPAPSFEKWK